jgi:hypothetical protein
MELSGLRISFDPDSCWSMVHDKVIINYGTNPRFAKVFLKQHYASEEGFLKPALCYVQYDRMIVNVYENKS